MFDISGHIELARAQLEFEKQRRQQMYDTYVAQRKEIGGEIKTRVEFDLELDNAAALQRIAAQRVEINVRSSLY